MTSQHEDPMAAIVRQAEELNQARMEAVRPLADVLARRKALQAELAATDEEYGRAYADAQRNGWTQEELKGIGAEEPTRRPRGRPAKKRTAKKSTPQPAKSSDSTSGIGAASASASPQAPDSGADPEENPAGSLRPSAFDHA